MANKDMEEKTYWTGGGVVLIDGTKYGDGKEIPADKVDPKTLEKWKKNGDVSNTPISVGAGASDVKHAADIKVLEAENTSLKNQLKKGKKSASACKECPKKDKLIKELEENAVEQNDHIKKVEDNSSEKSDQIKELEEQVEKLTAPGDDAGSGGG